MAETCSGSAERLTWKPRLLQWGFCRCWLWTWRGLQIVVSGEDKEQSFILQVHSSGLIRFNPLHCFYIITRALCLLYVSAFVLLMRGIWFPHPIRACRGGLAIRDFSMFSPSSHTKQCEVLCMCKLNWPVKQIRIQTTPQLSFPVLQSPWAGLSYWSVIRQRPVSQWWIAKWSLTCFIMECREMVGKLNSRSIIVRIWQFLRKN